MSARMKLWVCFPLLLIIQETSAESFSVQVSGATDDPTTGTDDGGLLCNGRYRWNAVVNGKNSYQHRSVMCTMVIFLLENALVPAHTGSVCFVSLGSLTLLPIDSDVTVMRSLLSS